VVDLSVDSISEAHGLSALGELKNLRSLNLGFNNLDDPEFLGSLRLQNLESLTIGESLKANYNLAPLEACDNLAALRIEKHTKNIEYLAKLPRLQTLDLRSIPKKQGLGFISKIHSLRNLVIILGGRENIAEIQHSSLEKLTIIRVKGLSTIDSIAMLPALRSLIVEHQIRLENVHFTESNKKLETLRFVNCKNMRMLKGLSHLAEMRAFTIGLTALNIDSLLEQRLPTSLKIFAFYNNKSRDNALIRKKLDALGYQEREERKPANKPA
jgi:hypothetical protein